MASSKEEIAREATVLRIQKVKPKPAPVAMTAEEYRKFTDTKRAFAHHEAMRGAETSMRFVMCRMCLDERGKFNTITGTQLLVRYEPDPLRAVGTLATCQCFTCQFEMHVNIPGHVPSAEEEAQYEASAAEHRRQQQEAAMYGFANQGKNYGREILERTQAIEQRRAQDAMHRAYIDNLRMATSPPMHVQQDYDRILGQVLGDDVNKLPKY